MIETRKKSLTSVKSIVIKLGTQLLSDKANRLDVAFVSSIARQIADLRNRGIRCTIVSSGAIGCGLAELKLAKRPTDLARLQAVAAVGQRKLMDAWAHALEPFNIHAAQLLITRDDIEQRTRYLNLRNTINAVHELGGVPIINENDTVSTDELIKITFGDNDILAAMVANALRANLLVLMTVVDGLEDAAGQRVSLINSIDHALSLVRREKSALGKGGMNSKIEAARMVTGAGEALVVVNGRMDNILTRLIEADEVGTLFVPAPRKRSSRARWIGSVRPAGSIFVNDNCVKALIEQNRSLLAVGITGVEGDFSSGDVVGIVAPDGRLIARGLCNYSAKQTAHVQGKKTPEVKALLKEAAYDEVVHRDNLVLM